MTDPITTMSTSSASTAGSSHRGARFTVTSLVQARTDAADQRGSPSPQGLASARLRP